MFRPSNWRLCGRYVPHDCAPAIVHVNVLDADKLGAAVPEPPKGFHLSGERLGMAANEE